MGNLTLSRLRRASFIVLTATVVMVTAALVVAVALPDSPQEVTERFLRARYARHSERLYELASAADRAERTLEEFVEVNPPFPEEFQPGVDALAAAIRFLGADSDVTGDQARVTIRARLPNSADGDLNALLHATEADGAFGGTESPRDVVRSIRADARAGRLPVVEVTETVDLIRESGRWRVIMGWDADLPVTLAALVADGLPLEFAVVSEPELRVRPGETARATFAVRNTSDEPLRVMATHAYTPPAAQRHVELIQCFCFFEERLDPGESRELSLVFRLAWDLPSAIDAVDITYRYRPVDAGG